ncbi:MAG: phosphatidylserine decarboxylase family protein [Gemmatimonadetes bacterium]|nr:phosphatidylserine decarboxylase family protein [Gemmatimonadota bacterium]
MKIAPEGTPFIVIGLALLVGVVAVAWVMGGAWWIAAAAWTPIAIWVPLFFRNPERSGPRDAQLVIAPADGKVVSIAVVDEPEYVQGRALKISVFMNVFNVHVNRHPAAGTVEYRDYRPGKFFNATLDKASTENERMSLGIRTPRGPLLIRQIAGLVARRIVTDHVPGDEVQQGQRLGLIRFGSRVDTFLPPDAQVRVKLGDRSVAGTTVLAQWPS